MGKDDDFDEFNQYVQMQWINTVWYSINIYL